MNDLVSAQLLIFKVFDKELLPAFLSLFLLTTGSYCLFLYLRTKERYLLFLSIAVFAQLIKAFFIFLLCAIEFIPNGTKIKDFPFFVLLLEAISAGVGAVSLLALFKQNDFAKWLGIVSLFLLIVYGFLFFYVDPSDPSIFVPTIAALVLHLLPFLIILQISHIELPELSLVIMSSFYLNFYFIFSIASTLAFYITSVQDIAASTSTPHLVSMYGFFVSSLFLFIFTNSLMDLITLDNKDQISIVKNEKKIFISLTHNIGQEIVKTDNVKEILALIISAAAKSTQATSSIVWLKDDDGNFATASMYGIYPPIFLAKPYILERSERIIKKVQNDKFKKGESYPGMVIKNKRPIFLTDLIKNPNPLILQTTGGILDIDDIIAVPILLNDEAIGVISVVNKTVKNQNFNTSDFSMMTTMADQVALAVSQFQLHQESIAKRMGERDLNIAGEIQTGLLPKKFDTTSTLDFFGFSKAAKGVGGDYLDYIKFDEDHIGMIMSDVAGKGVPASLVMVMIRSIFLVTADSVKPPVEVVRIINNNIAEDVSDDRYATFFYYIYDATKQEIRYTNAAHGPLLVYRKATNEFEELDSNGMPLGIMKGVEYEDKTASVSPGDLLILYTDGITEAMNKKRDQYGMKRLKDKLIEFQDLNCKEITEYILKDLTRFVDGAPQHDDMTLFISKIL